MTSKPIFTAYNNHGADSQPPPFFTNRDRALQYCGYFENRYGEQFVFVFDREKQQGTLWGGDCGWKTEMTVVEQTVDDLRPCASRGRRECCRSGKVGLCRCRASACRRRNCGGSAVCWKAARGLP